MPEKVVSHIRMPIDILTEGPEDIGGYWENGMSNSAKEIDDKRKARIKDEEEYLNRIADPSSNAWSKCFADDFISRAGLTKEEIVARQADNIAKAYEKYVDGLELAFKDNAKAFKERVAKGKKHYLKAVGRKLLPFTGTPKGGRGPVALACFWLTADNVTEGNLRSSYNILEGGPILVTTRAMASAFKSALNNRLIQAGSVIVGCNHDKKVIKRQNNITNSLVNGLVDQNLNLVEFTMGGKSHVDYIFVKAEATLVLDIQVARKMP